MKSENKGLIHLKYVCYMKATLQLFALFLQIMQKRSKSKVMRRYMRVLVQWLCNVFVCFLPNGRQKASVTLDKKAKGFVHRGGPKLF